MTFSVSMIWDVYERRPTLKKWRADFEALKLRSSDVGALYRVFAKIDKDNSGEIDVLELLMFLDVERTDFSLQVFAIMDRDLSGHIDFYEFAVAMWNYCTLGEESLALFAFDIYDKDCNGLIEGTELKTMLSDLYGCAYPHSAQAMKLYSHMANNPSLTFTPNTFRNFCKHNPTLFFPAFEIQHKMQSKVIGKSFWAHHASKRVLYAPNHKVLTVKDIIGFHTDDHAFCDVVKEDGLLCNMPYVKSMCQGQQPVDMSRLLDCCDERDPLRQCVEILDVTDIRNKRHEAALRLEMVGEASSPASKEDRAARDRIEGMFRETNRLKRFEIGHNVKKRNGSVSSTQSDNDEDASTVTSVVLDSKREKHRNNVNKWIMAFQRESERNLLKERPNAEAEAEQDEGFNFHLPSIQDDIRNFVRRKIAWKTRVDVEKKRRNTGPSRLQPLRPLKDQGSPSKRRASHGGTPIGVRFVSRIKDVKVAPEDALSWDDHPIHGVLQPLESPLGRGGRPKKRTQSI